MADQRRRLLKAEQQLLEELERRATATRETAAEAGWTYGSVEDLVLTRGRWYRAGIRMRPGTGFSGVSDQVLVVAGPVYVEGYVLDETDATVPAAWGAVDDRVMIGQRSTAYLGVPLSETFRRAVTRRAGSAAVLHGQELDGWRLLRNGLPPGAVPTS